MKRLIALLLTLVMVLGLTACSSKDDSWQEQYDLGVRYLSEGEYDEAIIAFTAAIEIDPKRAEAYVGRGDAYWQLGDLAQAELDYQQAWELDPENTDVLDKLLDALVEQGKLEQAADLLEDLIEKDPDNPDYYDKLADIYDQMGQPDKVEETLTEGVEQTGDQDLSDRLEEVQESTSLPEIPDDGIQREVIEISSGEELEELTYSTELSNLEIRLGDGDYNVSSLFLMNAENVSIIGTGKTRLISNLGTENIITLFQCDNFLMYGLVMGHELEPMRDCSTGVVQVLSSKGVRFVGCDIYGCGLDGIAAASGSSVEADRCIIRDCSEHGVVLYDATGVFNNCTFSGNCYKVPENPVFYLEASSQLTLNSCTIQDNPAQSKYLLVDASSAFNEQDTSESQNGWQ